MGNKISYSSLQEEIKRSSEEELSYLLGRYCGPHNSFLREKIYDHEASKKMQYMIYEELAARSIEEMLISDT